MRTLIEIYDQDYLKNVTAALAMNFDRVIYLCENDIDEIKINAISKLLRKKNNVIVEAIEFKNPSISKIKEYLTNYNLHETYVELNGGDGILFINTIEFCAINKIKSFYINHDTLKLENINDCLDLVSEFKYPKLSLSELIKLTGALIYDTSHYQPNMNDEDMIKDIIKVFNVMKTDFKSWTHFMQELINVLGKEYNQNNKITVTVDKVQANKLLSYNVLKKLSESNILKYETEPSMKIIFKNATIKNLFKDSGAWLEYYSYIQIEKSGLFSDCMMSVVIDYDGEIKERYRAECEIDVMCVKDMYPIFISCKASKVDAEALNEIKLHSLTFGNSKSLAVVITGANLKETNPGIYKKAKDLNVYIIDNEEVINGKIAQILQSICKKTYQFKNL